MDNPINDVIDRPIETRKNYVIDRISQLPDFIIHHIFVFLPRRDAAKTCVLSKRWQHLWASFPILEFEQNSFGLEELEIMDPKCFSKEGYPKLWEAMEKFTSHVDHTLGRFCGHNLRVKTFKLMITLVDPSLTSLFDKWVKLVAENIVDELCLHIMTSRDTWYSLPRTIYTVNFKSTAILNLFGCKLEHPFPWSTNLQKLSLVDVFLDERVFQNIILSCPLMEHFLLRRFWGLKNLSVSGLHKLKTVMIYPSSVEFDGVDIEAPSLEIFKICSNIVGIAPCAINLAIGQGLKILSLVNTLITDQLLHHVVQDLCLLETLRLSRCNMLERIRILNHRLKEFTLCRCQKLVEVEISSPNLLSFQYSSFIIPFLTIKNASCKWEVLLQIDSNVVDLDASWFFKLKQFLYVLSQSKRLNLCINSRVLVRNTFNGNEIRDISLPPPYEIPGLVLDIKLSLLSADSFLDGLFWSCHPRTLHMSNCYTRGGEFMQLLCKKLMDKQDSSCCISNRIKCWRHYLKNVKIETLDYLGDTRPLLDALSIPDQIEKISVNLDW